MVKTPTVNTPPCKYRRRICVDTFTFSVFPVILYQLNYVYISSSSKYLNDQLRFKIKSISNKIKFGRYACQSTNRFAPGISLAINRFLPDGVRPATRGVPRQYFKKFKFRSFRRPTVRTTTGLSFLIRCSTIASSAPALAVKTHAKVTRGGRLCCRR